MLPAKKKIKKSKGQVVVDKQPTMVVPFWSTKRKICHLYNTPVYSKSQQRKGKTKINYSRHINLFKTKLFY